MKNKNSAYVHGAEQIAEELLKRAEKQDGNLYWQAMTLDSDFNAGWVVGDGLYSGNAGMALFFIELARQSQNERYLEVAAGTLRWLTDYCETSPRLFLAGFTGRSSNIWPMLRMAEVSGDDGYYQMALDLARTCTEFEDSPRDVDDLLNGKAGIILPLIHLHSVVGEPFLIETVKKLVNALVDRAQGQYPGLYWDRSYDQIRGLCGFSHGACGVGYALMELGFYLNDQTCYWLAEQAIAYETNWHQQYGFWPDFRKMISTPDDEQKHLAALAAKDWGFFSEPQRMEAWCHGSPGIGFSRLRAYERTGDDTYLKQLQTALDNTATIEERISVSPPNISNFTLCHGRGGNRDLFIEAHKVGGLTSHIELAHQLGDAILEHIEQKSVFVGGYPVSSDSDTSLFMGNAGIGYFLLRLVDPEMLCILAPKLKTSLTTPGPDLELKTTAARRCIVTKSYRRTLALLDKLLPEETERFFEQSWQSGVRDFESFANKMLGTVGEGARKRLSDVLAFEADKLAFECAVAPCLTSTRQLKHFKTLAEKQPDELFSEQTLLLLNPSVKLVTSSWAWASDLEPVKSLDVDPDDQHAIFQPQVDHLSEEELNVFAALVLGAFTGERTVAEVITEVTTAFDLANDEERAQVQTMIHQQVSEAVSSGILLYV